jgi:hypothetical protein
MMKHSIDISKLDEIYDSGSIRVLIGFVLGIKMTIVISKLIVGYISRDDWAKHSEKFKGKKVNKIEDGYYCYFREENDRLYLV